MRIATKPVNYAILKTTGLFKVQYLTWFNIWSDLWLESGTHNVPWLFQFYSLFYHYFNLSFLFSTSLFLPQSALAIDDVQWEVCYCDVCVCSFKHVQIIQQNGRLSADPEGDVFKEFPKHFYMFPGDTPEKVLCDGCTDRDWDSWSMRLTFIQQERSARLFWFEDTFILSVSVFLFPLCYLSTESESESLQCCFRLTLSSPLSLSSVTRSLSLYSWLTSIQHPPAWISQNYSCHISPKNQNKEIKNIYFT